MNTADIRNEADYVRVLQEIEPLMTAQVGTPDGEKLDRLVAAVEAYERQQYPMPSDETRRS